MLTPTSGYVLTLAPKRNSLISPWNDDNGKSSCSHLGSDWGGLRPTPGAENCGIAPWWRFGSNCFVLCSFWFRFSYLTFCVLHVSLWRTIINSLYWIELRACLYMIRTYRIISYLSWTILQQIVPKFQHKPRVPNESSDGCKDDLNVTVDQLCYYRYTGKVT